MADKIPVKATFDANGDADGLAEFQSGETVGYTHGGTGLAALGTAGQVIKVNAGADALEWGSIAGDIEEIVTSATSGLSGGAASGTVTIIIEPSNATTATVNGSDIVLIGDADDSNNLKRTTAQDIANLGNFADIGLVIALG
jgi:hypothetical protein